MRAPLAALSAAVLLASCGSAETPETTRNHSAAGVSLSVPKDWTEVASGSVALPARGTFAFGLRGAEKYGEYENLNVVSDDLAQAVTSLDYADANFGLTAGKLHSETALSSKTVKFPDGTAGKVRAFEGKYNATTNLKRYVQTARVCGAKAYVATFTLSSETRDLAPYAAMLATLSCDAAKQ